VKIIEVDGERRRLSLSLKRVEDTDPVQPRADGAESVHTRPAIDLSEDVFAEGSATVEDETEGVAEDLVADDVVAEDVVADDVVAEDVVADDVVVEDAPVDEEPELEPEAPTAEAAVVEADEPAAEEPPSVEE
jgi:small subunit ribosomal protein S1